MDSLADNLFKSVDHGGSRFFRHDMLLGGASMAAPTPPPASPPTAPAEPAGPGGNAPTVPRLVQCIPVGPSG